MKKNVRINLFIGLLICIVSLLLSLYFAPKNNAYFKKIESSKNSSEIIELIKNKYVDEVNIDSLSNLPIDSLLNHLDPHSNYLSTSKNFQFTENLDGDFEGVGIQYYILNDTLVVTNVMNESPASNAGIKIGDKILKIDSLFVSGKSLNKDQVVGKMKGKSGTEIEITILQKNQEKSKSMTLKRSRIEISSIDAAYMIDDNTAYIRISKFGANTEIDFVNAFKTLKKNGAKKLILDLRDNAGGYLNAAIGLANQLFEEGKLITYTKGKHEPRTDYYTTGGGVFEYGELTVLTNEYTASASEILVGAIQDLNRGKIIGRRTFGKGLVQEQFQFNDGSALNLTVAKYFTPSGRSIQKPYKMSKKAYQNDIAERLESGELTDDSVFSALKNQNTKKSLLSKGGIIPDIYIKLDTAGTNIFYAELLSKKILFNYVLENLSEKYTANYLEQNLATFEVSEVDYQNFINYTKNKKLNVNQNFLLSNKKLILTDLKLLLYKYNLGNQGYYKAQNLNDSMIKEAINSMQ
ncbi:MAG: S41 family peptidase [Sphingobacteriaceae bacterium]|nr:S41 family peptidase [Sphingobacteriaceae bacterium]